MNEQAAADAAPVNQVNARVNVVRRRAPPPPGPPAQLVVNVLPPPCNAEVTELAEDAVERVYPRMTERTPRPWQEGDLLPQDDARRTGFYRTPPTIRGPIPNRVEARNNKLTRKAAREYANMCSPTPIAALAFSHAKTVRATERFERAVVEGIEEKTKTDSHLKQIPRHREPSAFDCVNVKPNPAFHDNPVFVGYAGQHHYSIKKRICFITYNKASDPIYPDKMLAGVLSREALFKPRTPALLEQLRNKAVRYMSDYDVTSLTAQQLTDVIADTVAYVYAGTKREHQLARLMASDAYRSDVGKLNACYRKLKE